MTITPEETARIQAGYNELRQQRDMLADRCANLAQEIATREVALSIAQQKIDKLVASTDNVKD